MAGYANRVVRLDFPDLSEEHDPIFVTIKNPRVLPLSELTPADTPTKEDGTVDEEAAMNAMRAMMANLVKVWHVYDATVDDVDEDGNGIDQPLLSLPATAESIKRVPFEVFKGIMDEVNKVVSPS